MIEGVYLKRLLLGTAVLLTLSGGAALAMGASAAFVGGLALGYVLGALPFASWTWVLSRALSSRRGRALSVLLLAGKLGLYSALLFVGVIRLKAHPVGILIGMTTVVFALAAGCLWRPSCTAKEAS